ncbi:MAG: phosphatase PAP2 family protein [Chitinophagaceae bacterium]|nr:MAG: phosphatase PAP2 family protein [Chitinophagaceae bacterium]
MTRHFLTIAVALCTSISVFAQSDSAVAVIRMDNEPAQPVYHIKTAVDLPIALAGTAWTLYGFSKIYGRDEIPEAKILALDKNNINKFDRPVADNYSEKAKSASDLFFYGSQPLPLVLLLDKRIRKDALRVGLLYLEAMAITGTLYTSAAMSANRFRPYAYNPNVDMGTRTRGGAQNSFFAGHVALVGTATFFMAKVYSDYHPEMNNKWILYTIAGAATATTAYLRVKAGQHFRSDVALGALVGTLSGILVPTIHKNRSADPRVTISPLLGASNGFNAVLKLNRKSAKPALINTHSLVAR